MQADALAFVYSSDRTTEALHVCLSSVTEYDDYAFELDHFSGPAIAASSLRGPTRSMLPSKRRTSL